MSKYIKLDNNALNNMTEFLKRHFSVSENDKLSCVECRSLAKKILSFLPSIEVSEDCISREWILEEYQKGKEKISESEFFAELMWLVKNAPSVVPSGTKVECYARTCEKNKNGKCEEDNIILEFGCE